MSFNQLPEVIIELIGIYLIPAKKCRLEIINTLDIDNFCASATIVNETIKNGKSCRPLWHKCPPPVKLLGKLSCREHTPHFEKKQRIHKAVTSQIHFEIHLYILTQRRMPCLLNDISDHLQDILVALEKDVNGMVKLLLENMNGCFINIITQITGIKIDLLLQISMLIQEFF